VHACMCTYMTDAESVIKMFFCLEAMVNKTWSICWSFPNPCVVLLHDSFLIISVLFSLFILHTLFASDS
jgi:hypothetical protein